MAGVPELSSCVSEVRGTNGKVQQPGYTNAVDMWSIGCVAAAMLIGRPVFAVSQASAGRQDSAAAIIRAAARCDLHVLDDFAICGDMNMLAKDFIKRLLVLDERARLTADQALKHGWFTGEKHKQPIETRYDQAIAGWQPNYPGWDFKEHLDRFIAARVGESDVSSMRCLIPRLFDSLLQPRRYCRRQSVRNGHQKSRH